MQSFMSRISRVLIALVILFVLAVFTLFLIGGRQQQYRHQITINAPRSFVFQCLTDPAYIQKWIAGSSKYQVLTEGGHRLGARAHITVSAPGIRMEVDSEVLETIPDERLITALTTSPLDARSDFQLEGNDQTTVVTHSFLVTPKGWARIFAPFSRSEIQTQLAVGLDQLKQHIESVAHQHVQ
jgi:uncharacterized protein YndB with AHSA1/START domain